MKVRDLKNILENFDEDMEIVIKQGSYAYDFSDLVMENKAVVSFWGNDYKALMMVLGEQVGGTCDADEIEEEM